MPCGNQANQKMRSSWLQQSAEFWILGYEKDWLLQSWMWKWSESPAAAVSSASQTTNLVPMLIGWWQSDTMIPCLRVASTAHPFTVAPKEPHEEGHVEVWLIHVNGAKEPADSIGMLWQPMPSGGSSCTRGRMESISVWLTCWPITDLRKVYLATCRQMMCSLKDIRNVPAWSLEREDPTVLSVCTSSVTMMHNTRHSSSLLCMMFLFVHDPDRRWHQNTKHSQGDNTYKYDYRKKELTVRSPK